MKKAAYIQLSILIGIRMIIFWIPSLPVSGDLLDSLLVISAFVLAFSLWYPEVLKNRFFVLRYIFGILLYEIISMIEVFLASLLPFSSLVGILFFSSFAEGVVFTLALWCAIQGFLFSTEAKKVPNGRQWLVLGAYTAAVFLLNLMEYGINKPYYDERLSFSLDGSMLGYLSMLMESPEAEVPFIRMLLTVLPIPAAFFSAFFFSRKKQCRRV